MIKKKLMVKRLWYPPEVYYAKGGVSAVKSIEEKNILVIIAEPVKNSEYFEKIEKYLSEKNVSLEVFQVIYLEDVLSLKEKYGKSDIEVILSIGGGSILDPSKLLKAFLSMPNITLEDIEKNQFLSSTAVKLIAVPTTPGTGSESTSVAVIKEKSGSKKPYVNSLFIPELVILDQNFLTSLQEPQLMEFCGDIFAHAWEGSISIASSTLIQSIAKSSIELLTTSIQNYHSDKQINALGDMMYAGHLAGIVQGNAFVGVCHALAHSLEVIAQVPHGKGILYLTDPILKWMMKQKEKQEFKDFSEKFDTLGLKKYRDENLTEKLKAVDIDQLIEMTLKDPAISTTPIRMNKENLLELIQWILQNE
jgi:alcohol dehydrogenase class IV